MSLTFLLQKSIADIGDEALVGFDPTQIAKRSQFRVPGVYVYNFQTSAVQLSRTILSGEPCMYSMATEKQIIANRINASKSTGPRTAAGKVISSRNSTAHGFYSTTVLLPDEDREEYLRLARRLAHAYSPTGVLEEEAVRTIIEVRWQLRRANVIDTELFRIYAFYKGEHRGVGTAFAQDATQANAFSKLTRYQTFLVRRLQAVEKELSQLKALAVDRETKAAAAVVTGCAGSEVNTKTSAVLEGFSEGSSAIVTTSQSNSK